VDRSGVDNRQGFSPLIQETNRKFQVGGQRVNDLPKKIQPKRERSLSMVGQA
jgi:hypothetical protein